MYDDTCKFLAEHFSADFASWLLGETVTLTEIQPSELSLDPIRADAMILLQSEDSILHLEFQTIPKENIPFRMLDYRVRGNRRYKGKPMRQVVIYLKPTNSVREALPLGNTCLPNQLGVICITPPKGGISIFIAKSYQLSDVDTLELN
jgi:predicted transposase YdaD